MDSPFFFFLFILKMPSIVPFFTGAKQLTIDIAEPVIYLRGTAHDRSTQVLQGEVSVVLTKPTLASQVVIRFVGKSYMLWPEGKIEDNIKTRY